MQNLQETQDQEFQEVKKLAEEISKYSTQQDFIENIVKIRTFSEKVSALKIYQEVNEFLFEEQQKEELTERKVINFEIDTKQIQDIIETTELEEVEEKIDIKETPAEEKIDEEYFLEKEEQQEQLQKNIEAEIIQEISEKVQVKEEIEKQNEEERLHEERIKIVEIEKPLREEKPKEVVHDVQAQEKKFKLANIKGLTTTVKSLFDDDPLDQIQEEKKEEPLQHQPSLVKSNMPTDYLEAEKSSSKDIKLDINDRLAFTKMLFGGSQVELNQTIARLNSYKSLDEAKEYLSEVYYERDWKSAEEYAQRLWGLVESKFI